MKHSLIFTLLLSIFSACNTTDCEFVPPPEGSELKGKWEFIRVYNAFRALNQPAFMTTTELGYTERLEFDVTKRRMIRLRNNKQVENTKFSISKQNERNVITFEDGKEYSYYELTMEEGKVLLSLYQRAPVGAILADGGTFYYEKK